uniref:protein FAM153B-like isoform X2 n=1 Tax=Callithrix jacchus TaxID=9483 RepID=UPI0023DD5194|nr:protein FAM153B-like isoform X2 [Callithrix jacchus]
MEGPALQQEDPSVDATEDEEAAGLQQAGPALQQEDPSVDAAGDKEAAGLQQAGRVIFTYPMDEICSSRKPSWDKFNRTSYSHLQELEDSIAGSHRQVEERSKPAEKATKKLKVKKERKTSKPRKNTRRHAQNILHICKIS